MRSVPCLNADGQTHTDQVDSKSEHRQRVSTKVLEVPLETLSGEVVADTRCKHEDELGIDVKVELAVEEKLEETDTRTPSVAVRISTTTNGSKSVTESDLSPTLSPAKTLLDKSREGLGSKLVGENLEAVLETSSRDNGAHR